MTNWLYIVLAVTLSIAAGIMILSFRGQGHLGRYCSGAFPNSNAHYQECMDEGWKSYYSAAKWMK